MASATGTYATVTSVVPRLPSAYSTSYGPAYCKAASFNGIRVPPSKVPCIPKLRTAFPVAVQEAKTSSSARAYLLLAPFLLSDFLVELLAPALAADSSSPPLQPLQCLPLADLDPVAAILLLRVLGPVFSSLNFLFIIRIVMSWYPQLPVNKFPYVIAFAPTEPVLEPTRRLVPPIGGVDISPVIWVAIISFINEILLGPQGLLVLLSQQQ